MTAIYFFVLETTMTEKELHLHHFYVDGAEFVVHTVILSDWTLKKWALSSFAFQLV